MDELAPLLFGAIGFGLLVVIVALVVAQKRKIRETWTAFAQKHGLELTLGAYPVARGTIEGRSFHMGSEVGRTAGGRAAPRRVVQFQIRVGILGPVPPGLIAGKRGMLQGGGPVQTGDAEFDRLCWVDCPDVEAARAFLTPARRAAVSKVAEAGGVVVGKTPNSEAMAALTRTGYKVSVEWMDELRDRFVSAARALDA